MKMSFGDRVAGAWNLPGFRRLLRSRGLGMTLGTLNQPRLLARCYGTDKCDHGYMECYGIHLGPIRWKTNRVLEIGIGGPRHDGPEPGQSLRLWRDYFPRSVIAGMDIVEKHLDLGPRVRVYQGDQGSEADLNRIVDDLGGGLDIVIDDGSHIGVHQIESFRHLFPRLSSGGWYVIEDLSTSFYPLYDGGIPAPEVTGVGLLKELVEAAQVYDSTFVREPSWGRRPDPIWPSVHEVHIYPGIAFIRKGGPLVAQPAVVGDDDVD
jgi:hypothetical protein